MIEITQEHIVFARRVARIFAGRIRYSKKELPIQVSDLEQESLMGLCMAIERYDPLLGIEFTHYAFFWCRKYVKRAVRRYSQPLSVPENFDGETPVTLDIGQPSDYGDEDEARAPLLDRVSFELAKEEASEQEARECVIERIEQAMKGLSDKERKVLDLIYNENLTRTEVAQTMGIGTLRVSQLKEHALRKLEYFFTKNK